MSQMPPVFFSWTQDTPYGRAFPSGTAIAAQWDTGGYYCPYCHDRNYVLSMVGWIVFLADEELAIHCHVLHCRNCELFLYAPLSRDVLWDGRAYKKIEILSFTPNGEFFNVVE